MISAWKQLILSVHSQLIHPDFFTLRMGKGHTISSVVHHSHRNQVILVIYYSQNRLTEYDYFHIHTFFNSIRIHGMKIDNI